MKWIPGICVGKDAYDFMTMSISIFCSFAAFVSFAHYNDVIMSAMASQITSITIVYSVYSGSDQRKHQSSASLAFVRGIHRWPVNSPHKRPVTRKMFLFDDVIMWGYYPGVLFCSQWLVLQIRHQDSSLSNDNVFGLHGPTLTNCWLNAQEYTDEKSKYKTFVWRKCICK